MADLVRFSTFISEDSEFDEALSVQGRRKLSRSMKRRKSQLKLARKRARRRLAKTDVLKKRARRGSRAAMAKKLTQGKNKSELSVAKKKEIERRLSTDTWQSRIGYLQKRLLPVKRRQEFSRSLASAK